MEGHPGYEDRGATPSSRRRRYLGPHQEAPLPSARQRAQRARCTALPSVAPEGPLRGPQPRDDVGPLRARLAVSARAASIGRRTIRVALRSNPGAGLPTGRCRGVPLRGRSSRPISRHVAGALKRLGRWLPRRSIAMAECGARQRVAAITVELGGLDPRARAALAAVPQGSATDALRFERPSRTRVAAIAGLFLLAVGAGAFLLASRTGSGPGDSFARPGAAARVQPHPGAGDLPAVRGSGQRTRGPDESASRPGNRNGSARASSRGIRSERSNRLGACAPGARAGPASRSRWPRRSRLRPGAVSPSSSSAPSPAKSAGGCPPEFGYEC